ncbi:hypothetical protein BT69DRAFT_1275691 [Atractiella rhizophila]|nr:hypothetical protein BT69DRAFT_1285312 [Atractiella rhizophila]KAH8930284.1 hypothetical protein BT69DRAFT_1275691 [Atractiella rhizophila]
MSGALQTKFMVGTSSEVWALQHVSREAFLFLLGVPTHQSPSRLADQLHRAPSKS